MIYSSRCRHCSALQLKYALLCKECLSHIQRCSTHSTPCDLIVHASCFEGHGPIHTLLKRPDVATYKLFAALMFLHLQNLNWPKAQSIYPLDRNLSCFFKKLTHLPLHRFHLQGNTLLVPTLKPLSERSKLRLYRRYPKQILNVSLI